MNYHKSLAGLFKILLKRMGENNFKNKTLNKAFSIFFNLIKDIFVETNSYLSIDPNEDLSFIYKFIFKIYQDYFSSVLIKPAGERATGSGSIDLVMAIDSKNKSDNDISETHFQFIKNNLFFRALFEKLTMVSENLFAFSLKFNQTLNGNNIKNGILMNNF